VNPEYLLGMGKTGGRICLLLDIEKVITASDIINMKKAAEGNGPRPKDETNQIQTK
jgi:chemotaxis signal transduction protein